LVIWAVDARLDSSRSAVRRAGRSLNNGRSAADVAVAASAAHVAAAASPAVGAAADVAAVGVRRSAMIMRRIPELARSRL
jgi:hypothetical protein